MRTLASFALVAALATPALADAPIIGGTVDTGDPAVVMIAAYPTDRSTLFTCTGVMIGQRHVLTAAHCLDHPGFVFGVFLDADASPYPTLAELEPHLLAVATAHPHPDYSTSPPFVADIGIVELQVARGITPLTIRRDPPTNAMVGASVRIIGYGQTTFGTNNATKYAATTTVTSLDSADTILIGNAAARTCVGDSGGPAIIDGVVIGIDSYSDTTGCNDPAHFRRTDSYLTFIDQFVPQDPPPPPPDNDGGGLPTDDPGDGGGCSTTRGGSLAGVLLALLALLRR